jgi:hypothetical protein
MRKISAFSLAACAALALSACDKKAEEPTTTDVTSETAAPEIEMPATTEGVEGETSAPTAPAATDDTPAPGTEKTKSGE